MAKQALVSIAAQDDLCNWEFINQSDFELNTSDDDDDSSIYEVQSIDLLDSLSSSSEHDPQEHRTAIDLDSHHDHDDVNGDDDDDAVMESPPIHTFHEVNCARVLDLAHNLDVNHDNFSNYAADLGYDDGNRHLHHHHDDVDDDDEEESDDDDGDYDVDDELVPWGVKDKFVRQRIRKLGKRSFAKLTKSKRSSLIYTRPGCVRGKHGLGLKAF